MDWNEATSAGTHQNSLPLPCSIPQCPHSPPATHLGIKILTERYLSSAGKGHGDNGTQKFVNVEHEEFFYVFLFSPPLSSPYRRFNWVRRSTLIAKIQTQYII